MKANLDSVLGLTASKATELLESLSKREMEVAELMAEGLKNQVIAKKMGISPKTLDIHRSNLKKKLKADTAIKVAKVVYAHQFGER